MSESPNEKELLQRLALDASEGEQRSIDTLAYINRLNVEAERLWFAANRLYEADHWVGSIPLEEQIQLWTDLRDALGRAPSS